jgi:hypothetical protein
VTVVFPLFAPKSRFSARSVDTLCVVGDSTHCDDFR